MWAERHTPVPDCMMSVCKAFKRRMPNIYPPRSTPIFIPVDPCTCNYPSIYYCLKKIDTRKISISPVPIFIKKNLCCGKRFSKLSWNFNWHLSDNLLKIIIHAHTKDVITNRNPKIVFFTTYTHRLVWESWQRILCRISRIIKGNMPTNSIYTYIRMKHV